MATVLDVAEYILKKMGSVTAMKLQKLIYYSQAWSTVWDGDVIFPERIEAWANGPVCPELFDAHKGKFHVTSVGGNPEAVSDVQKETVDEVIRYYGEETSQYLSDLTHSESPWKDARKGLSARERGNQEITPSAMEEFYSSLPGS
ncbi:MAG: DUF4065 domain-containing protein [Magnetococcales bacterium]|nr:DUF4065 domain-containing protein [Magnetococcales bacterium]